MKIRPGSRRTPAGPAPEPSPDDPADVPAASSPPAPPATHRLRRLGGTLLTVVMALFLVVFVAMTVLRFSGGELLAIRTGSMEPKMSPGDLLISRGVDPRTVRRGDVITFRVPEADNTLVTHRVTKVDGEGDAFTTKGDANDTADPFTTEGKDVLGRQWFVIPGVGRLMVFLSSGFGTLLLIAVPGSIYLGQTLADRRARRRHDEAARAAAFEAIARPAAPPEPAAPDPTDAAPVPSPPVTTTPPPFPHPPTAAAPVPPVAPPLYGPPPAPPVAAVPPVQVPPVVAAPAPYASSPYAPVQVVVTTAPQAVSPGAQVAPAPMIVIQLPYAAPVPQAAEVRS